MLTWIQRSDGWYANGFRIELDRPHRWLLLEGEPRKDAVVVPERPLAVARTLTECKREAELLRTTRRRAGVQRRQFVTMLLVIAGAVLIAGSSPATSGYVVLAASILVTRSATILIGTLVPRMFGERHEVFYQ